MARPTWPVVLTRPESKAGVGRRHSGHREPHHRREAEPGADAEEDGCRQDVADVACVYWRDGESDQGSADQDEPDHD
jgi:hypothetical protein